jgi:glyoxylase-like metal-dependent hydrolase (beta-lactamase superfamily II)
MTDTTIAYPTHDSHPAYRLRVGHIDVCVLDEGAFTIPGDFLAHNAPPQELAAVLAASDRSPAGFLLPIHPVMIESDGQVILVDTGYGPLAGTLRPDAGKLAASMRAEGVAPETIDIVLFTHLHPDHAGGAVDAAGNPAFPRARYLINRTEYEFWWAEPNLDELPYPEERKHFLRNVAKDVLVALGDQIDLAEPGVEIAPGVTMVAAPGHTPGHIAVEVASDGERLVHIGDAAADPVLHLQHPDWFLGPDYRPAEALRTRRQLLDRAASERVLVLTSHFPFPGLGRVSKDGEGWMWEPAT